MSLGLYHNTIDIVYSICVLYHTIFDYRVCVLNLFFYGYQKPDQDSCISWHVWCMYGECLLLFVNMCKYHSYYDEVGRQNVVANDHIIANDMTQDINRDIIPAITKPIPCCQNTNAVACDAR